MNKTKENILEWLKLMIWSSCLRNLLSFSFLECDESDDCSVPYATCIRGLCHSSMLSLNDQTFQLYIKLNIFWYVIIRSFYSKFAYQIDAGMGH